MPFLAAFALGLALSNFISFGYLPFIAALLALAPARRAPRLVPWVVSLLVLQAGVAAGGLRMADPGPSILERKVAASGSSIPGRIEGRIVSSEPSQEGSRAVAEIDGFYEGELKVRDNAKAVLYLPVEPPAPGTAFAATARLFLPRTRTNPGQFDHAGSLGKKGIALCAEVRDPALFEPRGGGTAGRLLGAYRNFLRREISVKCGGEGGAVLAILLGERGLLDAGRQYSLVRSGLLHLVALSGLNIGMIVLLIWAAMATLKFSPLSADISALVVLPLFFMLVKGQPSVTRAVIMAVIFLVARIFARQGTPLSSLTAAFSVLLLINPRDLFDAGFQLTFAATVGILLLYGARPRLSRPNGPADRVLGAFWIGIAAQLFTLPFLVWHFQRVSPAAFLFTPVAAAPLFPLLGLGLLYIFGGCFVPVLGDLLLAAMGFLAKLFLIVPELTARRWFSSLFFPAPHLLYGLLFAAGLAMLAFLKGKRKLAGAVLVIFATICGYHFPSIAPRSPADSLVVADVGQGSCQFLLYDGRAYLVDVPDTSYRSVPTSRSVVEPALAALGIRRIDGIFITHWDRDHAGSLGEIVSDLGTGFVAFPASSPPPEDAAKTLAANGVREVPLSRGDGFDLGRARFDVLHPPADPSGLDENDLSLVLSVRLNDKALLFTGDVSNKGLSLLDPAAVPRRCDVLIAPHHGSRNSLLRPLAARLSPDIVVFSAGRNNRFNHPHPSVVDFYRSAGSRVARTDRDGALLIRLDGGTSELYRYIDRPWEERLWE